MAVNKHFHTSGAAAVTSEKNLYADLVAEAIQIYGHDVHYLDRTLVAEDTVLGEDSISKFQYSAPIEMYMEDADGGFAGERELMTQFGLQNLSEATFVVSKERFQGKTKQVRIESGTDTTGGSILVESGTDVFFSAKVTGTFGTPVNVFYRSKNGTWSDLKMFRAIDEVAYHCDIRNVTQSLEYYIASEEVQSDIFQIEVRRAPTLSRFQLRLHFPVYTQLLPELLEENFGDLKTLTGTRVEFEGSASKPIAHAKLIFDESDSVLLKIADENLKKWR